MAKKSSLLGGVSVKVENRSGFDKSRLNILTTKVGTITPIAKQLMIPGDFNLRINLNAELPPLASDAYLRSHLKVEAFFVPLRLCYGGFESWFCGKEMYDSRTDSFVRAKLPNFHYNIYVDSEAIGNDEKPTFEAGSLMDYLGCKYAIRNGVPSFFAGALDPLLSSPQSITGNLSEDFNIFPLIAYHLIYDHWYRNKLVQRPCFAPIDAFDSFARENFKVSHLPFSSFRDIKSVFNYWNYANNLVESSTGWSWANTALSDMLLDGVRLNELRQRNYGDDYFTAASPTAQEGSPVVVSTAGGSFTISALRMQNALQEFAEVNNFASADYVQTMSARYGTAPSAKVVQKPVLLGSADFPFYTRGVNVNSSATQGTSVDSSNPWVDGGVVGATAGKASAQGREFVCSGHVDEPGYLMVMASFVPEANYASGISHDMKLFTKEGSLVDLPVGLLEHVGNEPIFELELNSMAQANDIFGYVQRYLWHKAGQVNEVHGLYRYGESLESFVPQRYLDGIISPAGVRISSDFLRIDTKDLDGITAVVGDLSQYGVMIDSAIELFVSEPLSESALPALSNPALEHGRSVYLKHGGSKLS